MVQVAPDQQEEQQRDGAVEIGVVAAGEALLHADAGDQDHADADRHVHVGAKLPQGGEGRGEERHAGIGDRRQRDQRRDKMHQFARGRPHALHQTGPDADRQQHHVARGEPRHRQRAQQHPPGAVLPGLQRRGIEGDQPVAQPLDQPDQPAGFGFPASPDQPQPSRGHVHPRLRHGGVAPQHAFDQPDAGAALQPVDGQCQFAGPVRIRRHIAAEVQPVGGFRARRARRRVEQSLLVVSPQPQAANGFIGRRAAGAAEPPALPCGQAAMRAGRIGGNPGTPDGGRRGQGIHRTISRRTARTTSLPC